MANWNLIYLAPQYKNRLVYWSKIEFKYAKFDQESQELEKPDDSLRL